MLVNESLKTIVDESLNMIVDESLDIILDESLDMIMDESLMVEDKSLVKLVDETLKLDEEHFKFMIADDSDGLLPGLMRRDINSLFSRIDFLSRRLCGRETAHALVEKKGKAKDKYFGKLILDLGNEVRFIVEQGTATMEKLVERFGNTEDKVECRKLKKELEEARGFVFEERPNEAIDVPIKDEKSPSSES
ncbi:hypothetical protein Tco_0900951 [Tanacetum coccineum]